MSAPSVKDIAIIEPVPGGSSNVDDLSWYLARATQTLRFNATVERQERATLIALFGLTVAATTIAQNPEPISSPPTQAQVVSLQATINQMVAQINILTTALSALVTAANANLTGIASTPSPPN